MSQIFLGGGCSLEEARSEWIMETEFVPCKGNLQIQAKAWQQEHGGKKHFYCHTLGQTSLDRRLQLGLSLLA